MPSDIYDLDIIDQAYGLDADLYTDVLRVSYLASDAEIQSAFFDRRSEIFTVLSKLNRENDDSDMDDDEIALSQRRFAERRMDAVVMAFRILKDPELRAIYEEDRDLRVSRRTNLASNAKERRPDEDEISSPRGVLSFDDSVRTAPFDEKKSRAKKKKQLRQVNIKVESPPRVSRTRGGMTKKGSSRASLNASRDLEPVLQETTSGDETDVKAAVSGTDDEKRNTSDVEDYTDAPRKKPEGVLAKIRESTIVKSISDEIHGAYLDTYSAFDQVFNAFTLQDAEIDAVCGRINTAKDQLAPE
jgi:hypothetical protein